MKTQIDGIPLTGHLVATEDTSELFISGINNTLYHDKVQARSYDLPQHLYLTSQREIKEGEWMIDGSGKLRKSQRDLTEQEIKESLCGRVEFTNDKLLISDGVHALPNFGWLEKPDEPEKLLPIRFLQEFVKRYNGEPKGIDVEKLASELDKSKCTHFKREHTSQEFYDNVNEGIVMGYTQALQSNDKIFSLKDILKTIEEVVYKMNSGKDWDVKDIIQSLTKEQPKAVEMWCEMEESFRKHIDKIPYRIKKTNGQPIIHFK